MFNPYEQPTSYATLGVGSDASAAQIRDRYNDLAREIQEAGGDAAQRAKRLQEIESAYNQLRAASARAAVDFFLLDPRIGQKHSEAIAKELLLPNTKVEGLLQPKSVRVTHAAILAEPKQYIVEPPPVSDLHPQPIEAEAATAARRLPGPLAVVFDC